MTTSNEKKDKSVESWKWDEENEFWEFENNEVAVWSDSEGEWWASFIDDGVLDGYSIGGGTPKEALEGLYVKYRNLSWRAADASVSAYRLEGREK